MHAGATTFDVATRIGAGLARAAVAGKVSQGDDEPVVYDLHRPLPGDCRLTILTASDDDPDALSVLRHSAAHVMAEAICKLHPAARLVYGPPLEDGFYYDIDLAESITPEEFPRIEEEMERIVREDRRFCRVDMPRSDAMAKLHAEGNRYKVDNAERAEGDTLSFYVTGERIGQNFEDLCRGPHVPSTGVIKAFKIKSVSRSFYRGDVNDQPLQRVYGTAYFKKKSLTAYFEQLEQAKARDHRVIGKELGLFCIDQKVGSGQILWLPKGAVIRAELQKFLTQEMVKRGYDIVFTPHVGRLDLYRTSGHYPYYEDSQYPPMFETDRERTLHALLHLARRTADLAGKAREDGEGAVRTLAAGVDAAWPGRPPLADRPLDEMIASAERDLRMAEGYLLRPMNCPHHIQVYASAPRSYRDLPVRLAEYGTVYRFEQSGELSGMTRVRGFTQDDAHLFCTEEQLLDECLVTVDLTRLVLDTLGLKDYRVRVGLRGPDGGKYVGSPQNWDKAEEAVRQAARRSGVEFSEEVGEAAFYGPKIDFMVKDCIGRTWQLGTVQVDYNLPERFDLTYIGRDNHPHRPIMIHRAPFGSLERFVGILIEHFAGAFPLWLSPVQVAVASVSEKSAEYARSVFSQLKAAGLRAELDASDEKIGPKKHRFRAAKINYILVVGEEEVAAGTVNVNDRDGRMIGNMTVDGLVAGCQDEIERRALVSPLTTRVAG
ncbi:MAG: threonine--tRNA ligase [Phycisphaerales bacterium]|nr:MAG: threonine--tRNA ligase [Phycisphaerales bacterium]